MWRPRFIFGRLEPATVEPVLRALIERNRTYLLAHPHTPALYNSGVRYKRDSPGIEDWCPIPEVLRRRSADCKSLACWRVAELQRMGEYAAASWIRQGCTHDGEMCVFHIVVKRAGGVIEDPSRVLGMR